MNTRCIVNISVFVNFFLILIILLSIRYFLPFYQLIKLIPKTTLVKEINIVYILEDYDRRKKKPYTSQINAFIVHIQNLKLLMQSFYPCVYF